MTIRNFNESLVNDEGPTHAAAMGRERGPALLADAELDHVAAAGSKPGGTTDGRGGVLRIPGEAL